MPVSLDRRSFLRAALGLAAAGPLTACEELIGALGEACPEDPAESGGVTWTPDVMHPVFYGHRDLTTADGAPGTLRIWYPSYEGFTAGPPILKLCLTRYPVVLFLHGQPPFPCSAAYHRLWWAIPTVLARSGYVVVVPSYSASLPDTAGSANATFALDVLDWVREGWSERKWVDKRPEATIVAGHSYGALLAARLVGLRPSIGAYVGLGAPWDELHDSGALLQSLTLPKLLMWGRGLFFEDLGQRWGAIPAPKHGVDYAGEHFDYIRDVPGCSGRRGSCDKLELGTADLVTLFVSRYIPVGPVRTTIPVDLAPPAAPLTREQEFYASGRVGGLAALQSSRTCSVALRWEDGGPPGSRVLVG